MDGIEKAINGLKHCTTSLGCFECPYSELDERSIECQLELDRDALELLKEQHETIKSLEQEIRDKNVRLTERAEQVERLLKKSVPQGVVDQIRWERDTALSQLKEIGKGLGEKMDDKWNMVSEIYPNEGEIVLIATPEYTDKDGIEYVAGVQFGYWTCPHDPTWFSSDGVTYGNGGMLEVEPVYWMRKPNLPNGISKKGR